MRTSEKMAIAHVKQDDYGKWSEHLLEDHLLKVAGLASEKAEAFNGSDWAYLAGLWHDLGKYRSAFQNYIRQKSGYDPDAHIEDGENHPDHSTAGAIYAMDALGGTGLILSYLIAGHHAGLPDYNTAEAGNSSLMNRLNQGKEKKYLEQALSNTIPKEILESKMISTKPIGGSEGFHLWLRILFSCLVDADFLDTENFMDPEKYSQRQFTKADIRELKNIFDSYMSNKLVNIDSSPVNQDRAVVLKNCREAALLEPGLFSLTVPTGGGKTLSSMAFALEHAAKHDKRRIIIVIPYTSIIEQTANQYREIFGDIVIEHHCNLSPDKENAKSRLATENWDAPIIVTTNVQLLESLFAARTSRCRKLHNIVNSVIIIDEAQLLPPEFLQPTLDVLRLLTKHYNVSLVLSTATRPAFSTVKNNFGQVKLRGLEKVREIISDVPSLYKVKLELVDVRPPVDVNQRCSWEDIADEINKHESVLAIVNTRKDSRCLLDLMPYDTLYLSGLMCGQHRSNVIAKIKEKLKSGEPVKVISTQLVECGVDLDFPVVYRALSGLDSIAQAAGRCNREGKLDKGQVIVFVPPTQSPAGMLQFAEQATRDIWHEKLENPIDQKLFEAYFQKYFSKVNLDKENITELLTKDAQSLWVQFRSAANKFKIIDDSATKQILVPYDQEAVKWIGILRAAGPERYLMRHLQRYAVTIYDPDFRRLEKAGVLEQVQLGIWAVCTTNGYDERCGLLDVEDMCTGSIVI